MTDPASTLDEIGAALDAPVAAPVLSIVGSDRPDGGRDADDDYDAPLLPADCPVQPLGLNGQTCWYLDELGQIVSLEANNKHGINALRALFGRQASRLESLWPRWSKPVYEGRGADRILVEPSVIVGFDQSKASAALIHGCARAGIFDPQGKVRGRGAHALPRGGLALHLGDAVYLQQAGVTGALKAGVYVKTGVHGGLVYPEAEPLPRPWHEPAKAGVAHKLLDMIDSWQWKRPQLDPLFMLGWIGLAMIGGAPEWRSVVWVTGDAGCGKSTFNGPDGLIKLLLGAAVVRSGNASAAYIASKLQQQTLPVVFDEIEAKADNSKVQATLELARVAASGDGIGRGTADGGTRETIIRSPFMFSSILIPPLDPQDVTRIVVCELLPLPVDAEPLKLDAGKIGATGRQLLRRMIDGWPRWQETLDIYREALRAGKHTARACDTFGTLLACADLLMHDEVPDAELAHERAALCDRRRMSEVVSSVPENIRCLRHLTTTPMQPRGGDLREPVDAWIGRALYNDTDKAGEAIARLADVGLKLVTVTVRMVPGEDGTERPVYGAKSWVSGPCWLAIAQGHRWLDGVYAGTKWQGGTMAQALARFERAHRPVKVKFGRSSLTAVCVPIDAVIDIDDLPSARPEGAVAEAQA